MSELSREHITTGYCNEYILGNTWRKILRDRVKVSTHPESVGNRQRNTVLAESKN